MDISFIILNYRQKGLVKQCLKSIYASRIRVQYEIIVVDNSSDDGCLAMVHEHFDRVRTVQLSENQGYAAGNNAGIKIAQGEFLAIINPDVILTEGVTEKVLDCMRQHPLAALAGPQLLNPDGTIQDSCRRFPSLLTPLYRHSPFGRLPHARRAVAHYRMQDWDHASNRRVEWLFGALLFARRQALEKIGIFDERFFLYYEDLDLCRRAWEGGFEVWYVATAEAIHYHQQLSAKPPFFLFFLSRATRVHIASALKYARKYFGKKIPAVQA